MEQIDSKTGILAKNLTKKYAEVIAVEDLSIFVGAGTIHALLGPNGSGKTTALNMLSCLTNPTNGIVNVDGTSMQGMSRRQAVQLGIVTTMQPPCIWRELTVFEQLMLGHLTAIKNGRCGANNKLGRMAAKDILGRLGLWDVRHSKTDELPFPQVKLTELARAIAQVPKYLIMDEIAAGAGIQEIEILKNILIECKENGIGIIMADHIIELLVDVADDISVLNSGKLFSRGNVSVLNEEGVKNVLWGFSQQ